MRTEDFSAVKIGKQIWMAENLNVKTFRNGDTIPKVKKKEKWVCVGEEENPAWCHYKNRVINILKYGKHFTRIKVESPSLHTYKNKIPNIGKYGKLYNWYAVNDPHGLAPKGWHIPSDKEWKELEMFLGMSQIMADHTDRSSLKSESRGTEIGLKLMVTGYLHWKYPFTHATNESGFSAFPCGARFEDGIDSGIGNTAWFWSSTEDSAKYAYYRMLTQNGDIKRSIISKFYGLSVRCIRD